MKQKCISLHTYTSKICEHNLLFKMTISLFARLNKQGWKGKRLTVQLFEELKDGREHIEVSYKMSLICLLEIVFLL